MRRALESSVPIAAEHQHQIRRLVRQVAVIVIDHGCGMRMLIQLRKQLLQCRSDLRLIFVHDNEQSHGEHDNGH